MELGTWDVAAVGIKAILYAATLCATGGVFFLVSSAALLTPDHRRRIRRWVGWCVGVALVASVVRIEVLAASMGDGVSGLFDGPMTRMVLQAGEGRATGIRIVGLLLAGSVAFNDPRRSIVAPLGAIVAATSFMWIGHAWAANAGGLSVALLGLHLLGVAFWLGALAPLLLIAYEGDLPRIAAAAVRFGKAAVGVVAVLITAGVTLLWILLGTPSALWTSHYGQAVTIKLGFVACLLSLAALNKLRLTPRLQANDVHAMHSLRRSIRFEMLLVGLILVVTAILTTLMGPTALE